MSAQSNEWAVEEIKVSGYEWWIARTNAPYDLAYRISKSVTNTTNNVYDWPATELPTINGDSIFPALSIGIDNANKKIVIGYAANYMGQEGVLHFAVPKTGMPVEGIICVDYSYEKHLCVVDSQTGQLKRIGKAYGLLIETQKGYITAPFTFVCGGACIAAAIIAIAGSIGGALAVKFWSDAKQAEAQAEAIKADAIVQAERIRWEAIQNLCEQNPKLCYQWGSVAMESSAATVTSATIANSGGSSISDMVSTVSKLILPAMLPIIGIFIVIFKWRMIIEFLRDMFESLRERR